MNNDKLIAALNKAKAIIDDGVSVCDMMDRKDAEQYLDAQEAIDEALAALQREQWVPVSERLPPEGADVLALHDYGQIVSNPAHRDCGKRYGYQITRRYGNGFLSDLLETGQVTHWMPLPPAPQTEEPRGINVSGHTYVRRSATSYVCRRCGHDMCREEPKPCANPQPEEAL